jgi:hypothetical protein
MSPLPTALPREDEEAKRFDLLLLRLQLAVLNHEHAFGQLPSVDSSNPAIYGHRKSGHFWWAVETD